MRWGFPLASFTGLGAGFGFTTGSGGGSGGGGFAGSIRRISTTSVLRACGLRTSGPKATNSTCASSETAKAATNERSAYHGELREDGIALYVLSCNELARRSEP